MNLPKTRKYLPMVASLMETFGLSAMVASVVALFVFAISALALIWVVRSAPPRTLVITAGPDGSSFRRFADNYQTILAKSGVTLEILSSDGSLDNLQRLRDPAQKVDIGFVQSGLPKDTSVRGLISLGSVAYQPLWVFYRNPVPINRLSELSGKRIAVGAVGSGTRALALTLLAANGVSATTATFLEPEAEEAAKSLIVGSVDAVFLMGDSAPGQTLRNLMRSPGLQLYHFVQADAYVRRNPNLNKMRLPEGSIDFGKDLPAQDVTLIGPTVELVARDGLNPALSDLLLEVAQEVHGRAGLMQKRGEFPAPLEHEFVLSDDAARYYKAGKGFFYRNVHSFWLASLLSRILIAIVPLVLVFVPAIRILPVLYRWSILLRIYRCYRPLLRLERDSFGPLEPERVNDLLRQLDEIEAAVDRVKVPASFAYQFYDLRGHLAFVRKRLENKR